MSAAMTSPADALLTVQGLTKQFQGLRAVDGVDLAVAPGTIHGLIGPNGAGKTTLFNMISGMLAPTAGSVVFAGESLDGLSTYRRTARGVARTFQNIRMFADGTTTENVLTGMHSRLGATLPAILGRLPGFRREERSARDEAQRLLDVVGLGAAAERRAGDLPYGDQRRLEIARALASRPKLVLLDEPAAGMNPAETQSLVPLLRRLVAERGLTLLLVEHDMRMVMSLCDRISVVNFGRLIAEGTPQEVRDNPAVIEAYLGHKHAAMAQDGSDAREGPTTP
jgi:branched-chain amino acid transport system ATP-binding protein